MSEQSQLDELLEYCTGDGRVCPVPLDWKRLWEALPTQRTENGWQPPLPLILAAWHNTSDAQKRARLEEHIRWGATHGVLDKVGRILRDLPMDRWLIETPKAAIDARRAQRRQRRDEIEQAHERNRLERQTASAAHQACKLMADDRRRDALAPELLAAYLSTQFRVFAEPPFDLRIGERSEALAKLMLNHGFVSAAFLTAWNPESTATSGPANRVAQEKLLSKVAVSQYAIFGGEGRGADDSWPPEESVFVLGMSKRQAKALGREFRQNAVLWAGTDAVPALVLLVPYLDPSTRSGPS